MTIVRSIPHPQRAWGFYLLSLFVVLGTVLLTCVLVLLGLIGPLVLWKVLPARFRLPRRQWVELLIETVLVGIGFGVANLFADHDISNC